jgi:outer membrane protein
VLDFAKTTSGWRDIDILRIAGVGLSIRLKSLLLSAVVFSGLAGFAQAETLTDALIAAYRENPALDAARAAQRATDEQVPQALSGWRPTITAQGSVTHTIDDRDATNNTALVVPDHIYTQSDNADFNITLSQPLFRGFKTVEGTAAAEATVKAGLQQLLQTEQTVLLNAAQAYIDTLRDRRILELRHSNVRILKNQEHATNERFKAGELTKTDVAQAQASVAGAQAALAGAVAQARADEATYQQYVGHKPGKLAPARQAKAPASLEASMNIAHQTNPAILAAAQNIDIAEHSANITYGDLLPSASLNGRFDSSHNLSAVTGYNAAPLSDQSFTIQGVVNVPLYEGGQVYSRYRAAKENISQQKLRAIDAVRAVRQGVSAAWARMISAKQAVVSNQTQLSASQLALNGVRQEYAVGSRSTVDVLNAETAVLNAQIALVSAQHDQLLASYQLQAAMGHMTARHLHLGTLYNPHEHYNDVRNKWIGLSAG